MAKERIQLYEKAFSKMRITLFALNPPKGSASESTSGYMMGIHDNLEDLLVELNGETYNISNIFFGEMDKKNEPLCQRFRFNFENKIVPYNPR